MPNEPIDDDHYHSLLSHFGDLVREWQLHRETINRAINILSTEFIELRNRLDKDDQKRIERQNVLDQRLQSLKHWQWGRVIVEIVVLLVIVAFVIGVFVVQR